MAIDMVHPYLFGESLYLCLFFSHTCFALFLSSQVMIELSYQLGWFLEILVSLGMANVNKQVRHYLHKDIASLQYYMKTKEIITPDTKLDLHPAGDDE